MKYRLLLAANLISILLFSAIFLYRKNYEFMIYVGVIVFFLIVIYCTLDRVKYPQSVLWGLTIWAAMHMAGGGLFVHGQKLYELMLLPIVGEPYNIFKYDQFVHIFGFGVATCVMYAILKAHLKPSHKWVAVSIVIVMAGLGVGALNEVVEFFATVVLHDTGVGGYENTALDLVSNLVGAVLAMFWIRKTG